LWRDPVIQNLELLRATYLTYAFSRHTHDSFGIAILETGAMEFLYRGSAHIAPAGTIVIVQPDEVHTGHSAFGTAWSYRTLLPGAELLQQAAYELAGQSQSVPYFPETVIHDPTLYAYLRNLHVTLEQSNSALKRESTFLWALAKLIANYAGDRPPIQSVGRETQAIRQVRDYLMAHYDQNPSLQELANLVGLQPLRLLRVFRKQTGLPPHAFLTQIRIFEAKRRLTMGYSIADTALETGFTDQSHLSRHFKRMTGVTPGQYALGCKNVQDSQR
jgi:AraC-like DNA-binding protein